MRRGLRTALTGLVVLALAAVVTVASATGASATTEPIMIVPIQVSLTNQQAVLDDKVVDRGSVVQFRIRNKSAVKRTFTIGGFKATVKPHGHRDDPDLVRHARQVPVREPRRDVGAPRLPPRRLGGPCPPP